MSQLDKLIEKIASVSKDLRFEELKKVLLKYGYTMSHDGSSHCIFKKPGHNSIVIPKRSKILSVYVKMVKDVVESEEEKNEK